MMTTNRTQSRGFTLFIAILTASIILAIGISILQITLKEFVLASTVRDSLVAFYAADAGMECALYWDTSEAAAGSKFLPTSAAQRIQCMGDDVQQVGGGADELVGGGAYGSTEAFQMQWGTPTMCARVSVTKYLSTTGSLALPDGSTCPDDIVCTIIESKGYNKGCSSLTDPRAVERALRSRY
jgi:hypothetical protein